MLAIAVAGLAAGGVLGYLRRRRTQRAGRADDADSPATIP
jgi:NhaP-type Na+/H+ or K+/H+ antiporter